MLSTFVQVACHDVTIQLIGISVEPVQFRHLRKASTSPLRPLLGAIAKHDSQGGFLGL